MRRAMLPRRRLLLGAILVLALFAAGPHDLLHDDGGAAPDCQLCALGAVEVAPAPSLARAHSSLRADGVPTADPLPHRGREPSAPRAPPRER